MPGRDLILQTLFAALQIIHAPVLPYALRDRLEAVHHAIFIRSLWVTPNELLTQDQL